MPPDPACLPVALQRISPVTHLIPAGHQVRPLVLAEPLLESPEPEHHTCSDETAPGLWLQCAMGRGSEAGSLLMLTQIPGTRFQKLRAQLLRSILRTQDGPSLSGAMALWMRA